MKFLVLFALVAVCAAKNHGYLMDEELTEARDKCLEESGLTMEELKAGWQAEETPKVNQCFHRCLMVKTGLLNDKFEIQEDVLDNKFNSPHIPPADAEIIRDCVKAIKKFEECEDVNKMHDCFPNKKH